MRKLLSGLILLALTVPAQAALPKGAKAPDFVTSGAIGGKPFKLHLKDELRKGPVVLYFFPKAFTEGCTLEAHAFSNAIGKFRKAGAEVIGMSADDLPLLKEILGQGMPQRLPGRDRDTSHPEGLRCSLGRASGPDHADLLCDRQEGGPSSWSTTIQTSASMSPRPWPRYARSNINHRGLAEPLRCSRAVARLSVSIQGKVMKITTTVAVAVGLLGLAACKQSPTENKADQIEANAENTADTIEANADNVADNVQANAENKADAVRNAGDNKADAVRNTGNAY